MICTCASNVANNTVRIVVLMWILVKKHRHSSTMLCIQWLVISQIDTYLIIFHLLLSQDIKCVITEHMSLWEREICTNGTVCVADHTQKSPKTQHRPFSCLTPAVSDTLPAIGKKCEHALLQYGSFYSIHSFCIHLHVIYYIHGSTNVFIILAIL